MKTMNIFKKAAVAAMVIMMLMSSAITAQAAAGQWKQNDTGWWWERTGGWYPTNTWLWIDGNNDGKAECYYFDNSGYMLANTVTPDGYTVNADGAWTENGVVQIQATNSNLHEVGAVNVTDPNVTNGAIMDGSSWPQMTLDDVYVRGMREIDSLNTLFIDKVQSSPGYAGQGYSGTTYLGPTYSIQRNGDTITFGVFASTNSVSDYVGTVKAFFGNFPQKGMELNAFYDNTGYESIAWGRKAYGTTGNSDQIFGLPQGSYRMGSGNVQTTSGMLHFQILLTQGEDGKYYIFPNSRMHIN